MRQIRSKVLKTFYRNRNLPAGRAVGLTDVIGSEFLLTLLATTDQPHDLDIAQAVLDLGVLKGIEPGSHDRSRGSG